LQGDRNENLGLIEGFDFVSQTLHEKFRCSDRGNTTDQDCSIRPAGGRDKSPSANPEK